MTSMLAFVAMLTGCMLVVTKTFPASVAGTRSLFETPIMKGRWRHAFAAGLMYEVNGLQAISSGAGFDLS